MRRHRWEHDGFIITPQEERLKLMGEAWMSLEKRKGLAKRYSWSLVWFHVSTDAMKRNNQLSFTYCGLYIKYVWPKQCIKFNEASFGSLGLKWTHYVFWRANTDDEFYKSGNTVQADLLNQSVLSKNRYSQIITQNIFKNIPTVYPYTFYYTRFGQRKVKTRYLE